MLAACISEQLKRPVLYVSPHIDDADNVADDLGAFGAGCVDVFPVWEGQAGLGLVDATDEIAAERLRIAMGLSVGNAGTAKPAGTVGTTGTTGTTGAIGTAGQMRRLVLSSCAQALNQPVPSPEMLIAGGLSLEVGRAVEPAFVAEWLVDNGFERVDRVDVPGQFAGRGGIMDIFAPVTTESAGRLGSAGTGQVDPLRIEFFGDNIESIRRIDLDTQRSGGDVSGVCIVPQFGCENLSRTEMLVNLLPAETIIIFEEPGDIAEVSRVFLERLEDATGLYSWEGIYKAAQRFTCLEIARFGGSDDSIHMDVSSAQQFEHRSGSGWKDSRAMLEQLLAIDDKEIFLYCENSAQVRRISEIVSDIRGDIAGELPGRFKLPLGFIHRGFIVNSLNSVVVSHHEIFGQYSVRRRVRAIGTVSAVHGMADLQKGDYVVHVSYGIGKFVGIVQMEKNGSTSEYLTIQYADKMLIHAPVSNITLVQKYIGSMVRRPSLSRIGTKKWARQKQRVVDGVQALAAELLEVQAKRQNMGGFDFGADTLWQKEFEQSFPYQETPDQLDAAEQIKGDMSQPVPMDRLLCGDVGYGKTELAMRAAFKVVQADKQVVILVPTTVLAVQHGRTFAERFADFPVVIEVLNRFVPGKKARDIVARCKQGRVDILIGTHRLLSGDVGFKDLGLLIIDEEQRFGVEHKERLKRFRVNVDVLTMTATPIPRTLHMSMIGLRDISSLATPPLDRRSIVTRLCCYDERVIRKAILHELSRDGQVFFLHNRVRTIEKAAERVRKIVNDSSVVIRIAHGQMAKHELEDAMVEFVTGRTDILVCSTIIESGLDIPNANTMIINQADRFGLAQLHQLRGRVGRYKHRAYAYMLLPADRPISPVAAKRLKAIEEYSQLGAGFRIALRDLEIRGAGNILGSEQSGHINTVGYEMYCRLLGEAVKRLKNEPIGQTIPTVVDLGFSTCIPRSYISSDRQRMDVYRRIGAATEGRDLDVLAEELGDMFGKPPRQVSMLLELTHVRILAAAWMIKSMVLSGRDLVFSSEPGLGMADLFARAPGRVSMPDDRTVYIRLDKSYLKPATLMAVLRRFLKRPPR